VVVRGTLPRATDQRGGNGVVVIELEEAPSRADITSSLVERNHAAGILIFGSVAHIQGTAVRETLPDPVDGSFGRGIHIHGDIFFGYRAVVDLRDSLIAQSLDVGLYIADADVTLSRVAVLDTDVRAADSLVGDGIAALSYAAPGAVVGIEQSHIERSARAAVSTFGATVDISSTTLECNAIDLDLESFHGAEGSLDDGGENQCGCGAEHRPCEATSAELAPPEPLE